MLEEEKQMIDAAKALGLSDIAPEVYRDMLQPAARELGDGLATVAKAVKIALAPIEAGVWGYEQIKEWLSIRVTRILSDRGSKQIDPPPLSIAGPLTFSLIFAKDEPELKELYASLLATSMDAPAHEIHPSFVSIIQQLTADEAKILKWLHVNSPHARIYYSDLPEGQAFEIAHQDFRTFCYDAGVEFRDNSRTYLDNLIRLRILNKDMSSGWKYDPVTMDPDEVYTLKEDICIEISDFGYQFMTACIETIDEDID